MRFLAYLRRAGLRPMAAGLAGVLAGGQALCLAQVGSDEDRLPKINSANLVASTRWLKLQTLTYTDQMGKVRKWDMATRTTKSAAADADAVAILALLQSPGQKAVETLVVEQYRPPVGRKTVELPAGLIDKGESAEAAALRELKEETGFVGTVATTSMEVCMSPGLCDETVKVVVVKVDLSEPENQNPVQALDEGEYCVVKRVPISQLRAVLDAGETMPIQGLYLLALGLELGAASSP